MKKNVDKNYIFAEMPVKKAVFSMALPTIIGQLINLIYNIVDTIFIGNVGNPYMNAAVSLSMPIYIMCISFANLFGLGGGSLISRLIGRKEDNQAKYVASFSIFWSTLFAIIYSLLIYFLMNPILVGLGASSDTIQYAKQYVLWVVAFGSIPNILQMVFSHMLRCVGQSTKASLGLTVGGLLNIALDPLFMFVILPEGHEVEGAAMATFFSTCVGFIILLICYIKATKSSPLCFRFKYINKIRKQDVKELFSVGIPAALLTAILDIGNIFLNRLSANHGDLELAAIGIVMKAERIPNAINIGLCQGMLPMVAYNYAAHNETRRKEIVSFVRKTGLIIAGCCIVLYLSFAEGICKIFLSTNKGMVEDSLTTIALASSFLRIRCFNSPFQFINFHSSNCMQGMGYGKGTLIHAITRILVFYIPLQLLFDFMFGMMGLVSAFLVSEALSDVVALLLLKGFVSKNIQIETK